MDFKPYISTKIELCEWLQSPIYCSGWFRNFPVLSAGTLGPFLDLINVDPWNHSGEGKSIQGSPGCLLLTVECKWVRHSLGLRKFVNLILFHSITPWGPSCYHMILWLCHIQRFPGRCVNNWLGVENKKETWFVAFACFCGVNTPSRADFKLPMWHHLRWSWWKMLTLALANWCQLVGASSSTTTRSAESTGAAWLTDPKGPTIWKTHGKALVSRWQQRSQVPFIMWMWVEFGHHWDLISCVFMSAHWIPPYHFSYSWSLRHGILSTSRLFRNEKQYCCRTEIWWKGLIKLQVSDKLALIASIIV